MDALKVLMRALCYTTGADAIELVYSFSTDRWIATATWGDVGVRGHAAIDPDGAFLGLASRLREKREEEDGS